MAKTPAKHTHAPTKHDPGQAKKGGPTKGSAGNGQPAFGQPQPGPDATGFKVPHPSDNQLYSKVNDKLVQPFPAPRGGPEPILTLAELWGADAGPAEDRGHH